MSEEEEPQIIDVEPKREGDEATSVSGERSIVLAQEVLPETLLIVPMFERPIFPKMIGPVVIVGDELKREVVDALQSSKPHLALLMVRSGLDDLPDGPAAASDFHDVGVAVRVVQAAPPPAEGPLQLVVRAVQRFKILEFVSEGPVFRARVEYWQETEFDSWTASKSW
jgi:ATP-dependent Lon protease